MFTFIHIEIIRTEIVLKCLRRLVYKLCIRENEADALKALVRRSIKNTWFEEPLASSRRLDSEGWCCFFPDHFSDFSMHRPHYLNTWNWLRNIQMEKQRYPKYFKNFIFNLIGQSNNNFLHRPIKTRTQVLVHIWGPRARRWLTDGLNQRSIFLCGAGYRSIVFFRTIKSINSLAKSVPMNTYRQIFGYS